MKVVALLGVTTAIVAVASIAAAAPLLITLGLGLILACAILPYQFGVVALVALVVTAPLYNPAVVGSDQSGRLYLSSGLILIVVICGFGSLLQNRGVKWPTSTGPVIFATAVYCIVLYRPGDQFSAFWLYRPLQPVLLAVAVAALLRGRAGLARRLLRLALLFGSVGIILGIGNGVFPAFDPFVFSRPADLPYRAALDSVNGSGSYIRAAGAFVYPNVFGLFAAYLVIAAVGARLLGLIDHRLVRVITLAGLVAILVSGARADLGGLFCGASYLVWVASPGKRLPRLLGAVAILTITIMALAQTSVGASVLQGRLASVAGESGAARIRNTSVGWQAFQQSPIFGSGAIISRLDNGILLYLSMGGVVGFTLLAWALVRVARADEAARFQRRVPDGSKALLVVLVSSSLLQDSIGQTLSSYLLGLTLGLFAVLASDVGQAGSVSKDTRPQNIQRRWRALSPLKSPAALTESVHGTKR